MLERFLQSPPVPGGAARTVPPVPPSQEVIPPKDPSMKYAGYVEIEAAKTFSHSRVGKVEYPKSFIKFIHEFELYGNKVELAALSATEAAGMLMELGGYIDSKVSLQDDEQKGSISMTVHVYIGNSLKETVTQRSSCIRLVDEQHDPIPSGHGSLFQ